MNVGVNVDVLGWKDVSVIEGVKVSVGVNVWLGVSVMEGVMMGGVPLTVGVPGVMVPVMVGVGVISRGSGEKDRNTKPAQ